MEGTYSPPVTNNIDLRDNETALEVEENIEVPTLEEIQKGDITLPLKNLFFDTDKYDIKPESFPEAQPPTELVSIRAEGGDRLPHRLRRRRRIQPGLSRRTGRRRSGPTSCPGAWKTGRSPPGATTWISPYHQ
ncbi:MAG: hypothetical protein H6559_34195 [Lewinellaceae bacterium]|nr:hypothetical protein [Lewinellaceae bacterium]